jgi:hypothetical protein
MNIGILTTCIFMLLQSPLPEPEKAWLHWLNSAPRDRAEQQRAKEQQPKAGQIVLPTASVQGEPRAAPKRQNANKKSKYIRQMFTADQISQWAIFGAAIVGFYLGLKSLRLLQRQVNVESIALSASERAANAAKESAEVARQSLIVIERARIAVNDLEFIISEDRQSFKYSFVMVNAGPTPAHIYEMNYSYVSMSQENDAFLETLGEHRYAGGPVVKEDFTLQPHHKITSTTTDAMPFLPELQPIVIAVGYIKYRDVFGNEQRTNFAYRYCGDNTPPRLVTKPGYNTAS